MRCDACGGKQIDREDDEQLACGVDGCRGLLQVFREGVIFDKSTSTYVAVAFDRLVARPDNGVLRVNPSVVPETMGTPITPVRVVAVEECVCGQGATFCSCTRCRGCRQVIDGAEARKHVCSGSRELTQQELRSRGCDSVGPQGLSCISRTCHGFHYAYEGGKQVRWVNDWEQPEQLEKPAPTDKQASDLGGLLSEIVWEQRRMAR